jgi:AbrB family looped-hinge helix DNA binding protein
MADDVAAIVADDTLNTSQKIRRLLELGLRQADVARSLHIRPQFVSNVAGLMRRTRGLAPAMPERAPESLQARVQLGEAGRILVPAPLRAALGMHVGDNLLLRVEDGELRVITASAALRRAQDLVRQFVPEGRSLSNELIAERTLEAARD